MGSTTNAQISQNDIVNMQASVTNYYVPAPPPLHNQSVDVHNTPQEGLTTPPFSAPYAVPFSDHRNDSDAMSDLVSSSRAQRSHNAGLHAREFRDIFPPEFTDSRPVSQPPTRSTLDSLNPVNQANQRGSFPGSNIPWRPQNVAGQGHMPALDRQKAITARAAYPTHTDTYHTQAPSWDTVQAPYVGYAGNSKIGNVTQTPASRREEDKPRGHEHVQHRRGMVADNLHVGTAYQTPAQVGASAYQTPAQGEVSVLGSRSTSTQSRAPMGRPRQPIVNSSKVADDLFNAGFL
jgi:hypothetical protein